MKFTTTTLAAVFAAGFAFAGDTPSNPDATAYFINLENGASVSGPVHIQMGLSGMGIAPAGTDVEMTGHHHLLVNRVPFGEMGEDDADMLTYGIWSDDNHKHFGKGQTETTLELPAGTHTLQLVLGDMNHVPHDTVIKSEQITITVTE